MTASTIHLICGSTGAGKTTYAINLADEIGGARFSIDEWMTGLFWMDKPEPMDPMWAIERVSRCSSMIWQTAVDVARRGTPCVLEVGLTTQAERRRFANEAKKNDLPIHLHFLDVPVEERWRRIEKRNLTLGENQQLTFSISRDMFNFVEGMWEPPSDQEIEAYDGLAHREPWSTG